MSLAGDAEIRDNWPEDPWQLLAEWLPSNADPARPVMTLATAADGIPDARTLLLSEWDEHGLYFHTDSRSRKVRQLAADPAVALMLHFPESARQLTVQGIAEPAPTDELRRAFRARSAYLQQLAWQNTIEFAGLPLADRLRAWAAFRDDHADGFGQPPTWTGYLVRPTRLTFWIGNPDTASRRTEYTRTADGTWTVSLLAG
ncbi:pyridoxamine 5'-phosphate oxidase family protein [Pseudolysinimonas sp.]|uniref:pyridoxine/pyridoxamine 5'-phosphate oxidase n=1 Tax=Pseudolysinimonas sp. TaxID=2680009 RepID=UPI00286A1689|nr:pyridoxamine 5'-phosphate oxidase family protein [Pseudolysinimonas sp.]